MFCLGKAIFTDSSTPETESQEIKAQQSSDDEHVNQLPSTEGNFTHEQPSGSHSPLEPLDHEQQVPSQQINQFNSSISRDSLSPETLVYNRE